MTLNVTDSRVPQRGLTGAGVWAVGGQGWAASASLPTLASHLARTYTADSANATDQFPGTKKHTFSGFFLLNSFILLNLN